MSDTAVILEHAPRGQMALSTNGRTASREFSVRAQSRNEAFDTLASNGVYRGGPYSDLQGTYVDTLLFCDAITVEGRPEAPVGGYGLYLCVATYRRAGQVRREARAEVDGAPVYWIERRVENQPADVDINGYVITNTVGEPFDPPFSVASIERTLCGEWLEQGPDWVTVHDRYAEYEGKLNADAIFGFPAKCLFVEPFDITDAGVPNSGGVGQSYFRVRFRLAAKRPKYVLGTQYGGWESPRPNMGTKHLDTAQKKVVPNTLADGTRDLKPRPLRADGTPAWTVASDGTVTFLWQYVPVINPPLYETTAFGVFIRS